MFYLIVGNRPTWHLGMIVSHCQCISTTRTFMCCMIMCRSSIDVSAHWTLLSQHGNEVGDLDSLNDAFSNTCVSLGNLDADPPFVLQGNLSSPFTQIMAHVVTKGGVDLFDTPVCQQRTAMVMTHAGAIDDKVCRPFCGTLNGCILENKNIRAHDKEYELSCRCSSGQCSELLFHVLASNVLHVEICNLFIIMK